MAQIPSSNGWQCCSVLLFHSYSGKTPQYNDACEKREWTLISIRCQSETHMLHVYNNVLRSPVPHGLTNCTIYLSEWSHECLHLGLGSFCFCFACKDNFGHGAGVSIMYGPHNVRQSPRGHPALETRDVITVMEMDRLCQLTTRQRIHLGLCGLLWGTQPERKQPLCLSQLRDNRCAGYLVCTYRGQKIWTTLHQLLHTYSYPKPDGNIASVPHCKENSYISPFTSFFQPVSLKIF